MMKIEKKVRLGCRLKIKKIERKLGYVGVLKSRKLKIIRLAYYLGHITHIIGAGEPTWAPLERLG